jgi:hypothetical protein
MNFGIDSRGGLLLLGAMGLALVWALWTAWSGGALKRWFRDWGLEASRKFVQPSAQVAPPEVHRAKAPHGGHAKGESAASAQPQRHRSGQRHS